jgi:hypothetical protein
MKVKTNRHKNAIYCDSRWGPTVGNDISLAENDNNPTINSYSDLGYAFKHPHYEENTNEAETFLAGSHRFQLAEIEVYQKE